MPAYLATPEDPILSPYRNVLRHPTLRLVAFAMLLLGAHNASVYPYQSLIAIERIGLSKPAFSLLLVLASAVAVTASVLFGILGDQYGRRRRIAMGTAFASTVGISLMLIHPSPLSLVLCQGVMLPIAWTIYGQFFALARLASADEGRARDTILGAIRAPMSLAFLVMLLFWTFAFGLGANVMTVYVTGGLASLGMSLLVIFGWPRDGKTDWHDARSGLSLREAFGAIATRHILIRLLFLGAISSAGNLYMVLISLVFEASPIRGPGDVALYIGLLAGWEIPGMLLLPRVTHLVTRSTLIAIGTAIYTLHLIALPYLSDTPWLWLMTLFGGFGGAAILMLPIPYYQDLMRGRPGTASSMLALQKLVTDVLTAMVFALGTAIGGFATVAIMGTVVTLSGALGLFLVDRNAWFPARLRADAVDLALTPR